MTLRQIQLLFFMFMPLGASAATATLRPSKDTTIYGSGDANLSNGAGQFLFAGSSGPNGGARVVRSLIAFDLAGQIPAGATINSVTLALTITTPIAGNSNTVQARRLQADWGEGTSAATSGEGGGAPATSGSATWLARFFNTLNWTTPGGDFSSTLSASQSVRGSGTATFSGAGMIADVQAWVNDAATNFGWILMAQDESGPAVRFSSRQGPSAPTLTVDYTAGSGPVNSAPTITTQPASQTVTAGANVTFTVTATGTPAPNFQWRKDNTPIPNATSATLTLSGVTAANAGSYSVVVQNSVGSITSNAASLIVNPDAGPGGGSGNARLANLSILTTVPTAGDSFTMGYVVGGAGTSGTKPILIRAAGPTLGAAPFNISGVLADPRMELFAGSTPAGANDNWGGTAALSAAFTAVGAFPYVSANSLDAAVVATISAGDNSVRVSATGNATGTVIAELYDSTPVGNMAATTPRLVNVSVLKHLGTGLTTGFVIDGTGSKKVLIRAVGPTIAAAPFNVPGAVADPQLTLFSGQSSIGTNDNWGGTAELTTAFTQVGAFALPASSRDAALLATLNPGSYTVQVSGVGGTTGVAIVEIYEVP